jgi:hypothetical protein
MNKVQAKKFALRRIAADTHMIESQTVAEELGVEIDHPDVERVSEQLMVLADEFERRGEE